MSVQVNSLLIPFTSPIQICLENAEDGELFPTAVLSKTELAGASLRTHGPIKQ